MSRDIVIARGRVAAGAGMVDACLIRRLNGETTDPYSGEVTPTWNTVYEGKCRFQIKGSQSQQQDAGEAYILLQWAELQLPISALGVTADDEVVCTSAARDPDLADRVFQVRSLAYKTDATSRRLQIQERTS